MSLVFWGGQVICQRTVGKNVMWPNTAGLPSPPLLRSWLAEQGCAIGSPHLIWCFTHIHLLNVTVSSLHLLSAVLLGIQVFVEETTVLDLPAYFLLIPICPTKFETRLPFARQAGHVFLSIVSSDQYSRFSNVLQRGSEPIYCSDSSSPKVSGKICRLDSQLVIYGQFSWISRGAWRIDPFIHTEGTEQFEAGQVTPEPSGVVKVSCQTTRGR